MGLLALEEINKQFVNVQALDSVSFEIPEGCIFGLLGPNGAGKTTLIRIITGILGPDSGRLLFKNQPFQPSHISEMGYMPEERGLYKKMKVGEQLLYLTSLKGMSGKEARASIEKWLSHLDIEDWWDKKVEDLSKGMQQKVQFISTVAHNPDLLILDEPFSGLDPLNTEVIKGELRAMAEAGKTIIFSTHRMEQVEELCDHIALINNGTLVLRGETVEVRDRFKENCFECSFADTITGELPLFNQPGIEVVSRTETGFRAKLSAGYTGNQLLREVLKAGLPVVGFKEILPTINEIFIKQVNKQTAPKIPLKIRA